MRCLREWNTFVGVLTPMVGVNSSFHQRLYLHFGHMRPFLDSLTRDVTQSSKQSRIRLLWIGTFRMLDSVLVDFWFPYSDTRCTWRCLRPLWLSRSVNSSCSISLSRIPVWSPTRANHFLNSGSFTSPPTKHCKAVGSLCSRSRPLSSSLGRSTTSLRQKSSSIR